ncbi:flavonoid 3-O-glucosyltransferase-like [Durio zibethinus]|uniref:Glycosyltransferase n=1 Tax=Durio zibethinus TaxID=66656 RepID=A0A6P5ZVK8_DURZI|nr:flavonoid 3-O-glucosyltransferase-like [Durio zibethinus]
MANYKNASKHIAVLAFPFGTHAVPLLRMVRQLSDASPGVVFSFLSTEQSNNSTFPKDEKLDNIKPFHVGDGLPEGYSFKGNPHEPVEYFVKALPGNFREAIDALVAETGKRIDCLITDAFYWFAADIADELNVPWLALWTAGPRAFFIHAETDVIRRHVGINGPPDKALDFHQEFSAISNADLPDGITSGNFDAPVPALLDKMGPSMSRATAIAANSYEDLDNTVVNLLKSRFNMFLNIGPFNLASGSPIDDTHGCLDWLNKHNQASVVYISFGSVISPPPHELAALSEALEESDLPYLWSFRGNPEKQLPPGFLERTSSKGKIVPWAPQLKILENQSVGVFVTHGGWNSVLESIIGGVPMILRPFFGDQRLNTRTVESVWGFGLGLEGGTITKEGTKKALNSILSTEEGNKMRLKIGVQKELARKAVQPNGSSAENFKTLVKIINTTCHQHKR